MNWLTMKALSVLADVPNPGAGTAPPGFGNFATILGWGKWISLGILVMALMIAGVSMSLASRRGDGGEHASAIGWVLGGVMVVSGAFSLVSFLAT
jgi:hypothetical protein